MFLLGKQIVGIDIADHSIEVAQVKSLFNQRTVLSFGRKELSLGMVERGRIKDADKLASTVAEVLAEAKPRRIKNKNIIFGLPESQTFVYHCNLTLADKKEISAKVKQTLLCNVPIDEKELVYAYRVLQENNDQFTILAIATRQTVLQEWLDFFKKIKLKVKGIDVEILATFRDLFDFLPKEPIGVIDIGSATSFVGIFDKEGLQSEYIINVAGDAFTAAIAKSGGLDLGQAEAVKIEKGLENSDQKIKSAILEQLGLITAEVGETLSGFKEKTGTEVVKLILVGGSSRMTGLQKYFTENLHLPVQVGSAKSLSAKVPLEYVEAVGLALRGVENFWDKRDPIF